jgi:hypothetical protein
MNPGLNQEFACSYYENYLHRYCNVPVKYTKAQVDIMNEIRSLWEQHGIWTRSVITSIALDLPDVEVVTARLLQNPKDFGQALEPFYGNRIAARFRELLTEHLVIAAELVKASKAGDNKAAAEAERRWYVNGDEIAAFLGTINPYWSQEEWRMMLRTHLGLVKAEAVAMLTRDFEAGIQIFDEIESQALDMADVMSEGIIKQFSIY